MSLPYLVKRQRSLFDHFDCDNASFCFALLGEFALYKDRVGVVMRLCKSQQSDVLCQCMEL